MGQVVEVGGDGREGRRLIPAALQVAQDVGDEAEHYREVSAVHGQQQGPFRRPLHDKTEVREGGQWQAFTARLQSHHLGSLPERGAGFFQPFRQGQGSAPLCPQGRHGATGKRLQDCVPFQHLPGLGQQRVTTLHE